MDRNLETGKRKKKRDKNAGIKEDKWENGQIMWSEARKQVAEMTKRFF